MGLLAFAGFAAWAGTRPASAAEPAVAKLLPTAPAPDAAPDTLLKTAALLVTASLRRVGELEASSAEQVASLVDSAILPLFDVPRMTQRAVALDWRLASPEQQSALVAGFRSLLMRTYATALSRYHGQAIEFKPARVAPGDTAVTVRSIVKQRGTERISIDYDMEMTSAGWKVLDVRIAGISLIATSRPIFAQAVRESGVPGLINSLAATSRGTESARGADASGAVPMLLMHALISGAFRGGR